MAVAFLAALAILAGLSATPASAATQTQPMLTPVFLTNGNWNDQVLCASPDDDSVWLEQFDASNLYCQWIQIGERGRFLLFNPQKQKVASYLGGNEGAVVMQNLLYPAPNQQLFSWGGVEGWNASALQSYQDSGQNIDAKSPDGDGPRTDPVHTRGWRHGHQRELTWNELPAARPTLGKAVETLQSYQTYLNTLLGGIAPDETTCVTTAISLRAQANGKYVSAELGYTGDQNAMLRARAGGVGPWEQFALCRNNKNGLYSIRSAANGNYVTAELGYTGGQYGELRARSGAIGAWEQFTIERSGSGYTIRSAANGQYVSAEVGYGGDQSGMLRARSDGAGVGERFQ
ncbi:RICIN domain-containing protein [Streptomyces sp. NPDC002138]|uniref:fascin domain-containing protein n=1 Tax=Streptomyces sp. NPDC002138 TaxID=3154410 RepID=UPI00332F3DE7